MFANLTKSIDFFKNKIYNDFVKKINKKESDKIENKHWGSITVDRRKI